MGDDTRRNTLLIGAIAALFLCGIFGATLTGYLDWGRIGSDLVNGHAPAEDADMMWQRAQDFRDASHKDPAQTVFAIAAARRVVILSPHHVPARKMLAAYALVDKNWDEAEKQCREILGVDPGENTARLGLGAALKGKNSPASRDEAKKIYHQIWDDPKADGLQKDEASRSLRDLDPKWTAPPPSYLMAPVNPSPAPSPTEPVNPSPNAPPVSNGPPMVR